MFIRLADAIISSQLGAKIGIKINLFYENGTKLHEQIPLKDYL